MKILAALIISMGCLYTAALASPCPSSVLLTYEQGTLAGVDWVDESATRSHSRSELTRSAVIDSTINLRDDRSTANSSTTLTMAGSPTSKPVVRDFPPGTIAWSDMVPSSIQQAIERALVLHQPSVEVPAASLFSTASGGVAVDRIDATDWTVAYHSKKYLVLTDAAGCVVSASLADFGVTIERRSSFAPSEYTLWPPYAAPPDRAYGVSSVTIPASGGATLAGTLTRPLHARLVPGAVLITGLSPHERNNGEPPWMPLRDIADALTRAGFAVLRVDDRGVGESTGDNKSWTTFKKAADVRTEAHWLASQRGIDPKRIMLVGYSEGGLIAPMVAADDPSIAAIVTLAGPGVSGMDVARYQTEARVDADPTIAAADRERQIEAQLAEPLSPHESSYMSIDPLTYAHRVRCPALIIQGSTDLDVPVRSAERIAAAMRANGDADVTVRLFPDISHSLLPDVAGVDTGWATLPAFLTSPQILQTVSAWAVKHLK
ncbi:MAG TPA: alpha/beta fold hydrolase [Candidatus Eremiobacteraceae bacterium]|nr:alpha/beta fold hydrolase [Candidatus Eremiobacteraceae bacterium]